MFCSHIVRLYEVGVKKATVMKDFCSVDLHAIVKNVGCINMLLISYGSSHKLGLGALHLGLCTPGNMIFQYYLKAIYT